MRCLVTGAAGYIGSVACSMLLEEGHHVVALDNLETGHRARVPSGARLVEADVRDQAALEAVLGDEAIEAVLHFAALIQVGESMDQPSRYISTNVGGVAALLAAMERASVRRLVYSSTCAVYGTPQQVPIDESAPLAPISVYGSTKRIGEELIAWYCATRGFSAIALRYFNVGGACGSLGECHEPETHLIPLVLQAAAGERPHLAIFGTDYPTPDGTCIRDYLHVQDLVDAHLLALARLDEDPGRYLPLNLGTGHGYSVREVVEMVESVTGRSVPLVESPRRPGDPERLVASSEAAHRHLEWTPKQTLRSIVESQWSFSQR
ncbi:MAG: UDP-glucose 4-epimerase GalE [Myxococcales bacterium]|nr:UDP-glucose 4-epimerase GalE [Myxococcales bacterium]